MPTSARWEPTNSPQIFVKTVCTAQADVGIGPYKRIQNHVWADRVVGPYKCLQ